MTYIKSIKTHLNILVVTLHYDVIRKPWLPILYFFIITMLYALFSTLIDEYSSPLYCMGNSIEERLIEEAAAKAQISAEAQRVAEESAAQARWLAEARRLAEQAAAAEAQLLAEQQQGILHVFAEAMQLAKSQATSDGHH